MWEPDHLVLRRRTHKWATDIEKTSIDSDGQRKRERKSPFGRQSIAGAVDLLEMKSVGRIMVGIKKGFRRNQLIIEEEASLPGETLTRSSVFSCTGRCKLNMIIIVFPSDGTCRTDSLGFD